MFRRLTFLRGGTINDDDQMTSTRAVARSAEGERTVYVTLDKGAALARTYQSITHTTVSTRKKTKAQGAQKAQRTSPSASRLCLAGDTYARIDIDIVIVSPSEAKDISSIQLDVLRPSRWP